MSDLKSEINRKIDSIFDFIDYYLFLQFIPFKYVERFITCLCIVSLILAFLAVTGNTGFLGFD